jgi:hypothetical protein
MSSLVAQCIRQYLCFRSHRQHDRLLCEWLYGYLQARGGRLVYFPDSAMWSNQIWLEIAWAIALCGRIALVGPGHSLQSALVLCELEGTLACEEREGVPLLLPARIDNYISDQSQDGRNAAVVATAVGNFTAWDRDAVEHKGALARLASFLTISVGPVTGRGSWSNEAEPS